MALPAWVGSRSLKAFLPGSAIGLFAVAHHIIRGLVVVAGCLLALLCASAIAEDSTKDVAPTQSMPSLAGEGRGGASAAGERLLRAYPDAVAAVDGNLLVWRDGTRMVIDDGLPPKTIEAWLASPDLKDMFRDRYPAGADLIAPTPRSDPGRARNAAFFRKLYGDCTQGSVTPDLIDVAWLPKRSKLTLKVTRRQNVAAQLAKVSAELDALPAARLRYLLPPAGTYNCRSIAGTDQPSAHGYGIAVDIAIAHAHYWRWPAVGAQRPQATAERSWRNEIPMDIVTIFERHGFIWGGRWSHYDTMHFEYRPELLLPDVTR